MPAKKPATELAPLEHVELTLRTLALQGNSLKRTAAALTEAGHPIDERQIAALRTANLARYDEIRREQQHEVGLRMALIAEDLAHEAYAVQALAVEETRKALVHGSLRDPSAAAKNLATTAQAATQQAALYRGQPTQHVQVRSVEEIFRSLNGKIPGLKAQVVDAQVVEDAGTHDER